MKVSTGLRRWVRASALPGAPKAAPLAPDCSTSRLMRRSIDWMSPSMSSMACRGEFWRPGSHNLSIRDGMKNKDRVALARVVLGHREHTIALESFEKGILGTTLHYDYEVRPEKDYFSSIPTPDAWARLSKVRLQASDFDH